MNRAAASKPKSTNPFDDDDDDSDEEHFFDAQGSPGKDGEDHKQQLSPILAGKQRSAPLNFSNPFDETEEPALHFDQKEGTCSNELFSPLKNAMLQLGGEMGTSPANKSHAANTTFSSFSDSDDDHGEAETSPLLRRGSRRTSVNVGYSEGGNKLSETASRSPTRGAPIPSEILTGENSKKRKSAAKKGKRRSSLTSVKPRVLKELVRGDNELGVDYKFILLEDLGTASSWVILLLPYLAFFICVLLESFKGFRVSSTGPLNATLPCADSIITTQQPLVPTPPKPCHCPFNIESKQDEFGVTHEHDLFWRNGTAFESGIIQSIPVISTFLHGDAMFYGLSTDAVALVAKGMLESSVVVLQRGIGVSGDDAEEWTIVYVSAPKQISMACDKQDRSSRVSEASKWDCRSPRVLDVVFSMPETAVYAGGDVRINILYSYREPITIETSTTIDYSHESTKGDVSYVYTSASGASSLFASINVTHPLFYVGEIVTVSSYIMDYMSPLAVKVDTIVRITTFVGSFAFLVFWFYSMGMIRYFCCCLTGRLSCLPEPKKVTMWWQSPWILFPERRYIVVLLLSLLLMQDPVLALMYFIPWLGSIARLHAAGDVLMGIGVHGTLFVYLCLFHGFRYHTAIVTRKRAEHQRQVLQLRRAAKYVIDGQNPTENSEEAVSKYVQDYYDGYGDTDGSASPGHLRLENDPCGDNWADFLLPKLLLLFVGIASVVATAYCRFPPDNDNIAELSGELIDRYKKVYVASSVIQFATLLLWMYLIIVAALESGRQLRGQPFLSTRPAQLAYRILFAHITLGFIALVVTFFVSITQLLKKWSVEGRTNDPYPPPGLYEEENTSKLEVMMRVLSRIALQFPYSGTAASIGSGRILFATVSILITAFIFLPPHILEEEDTDDPDRKLLGQMGVIQEKLVEKKRLRRDKRLVVHLARDSRTWRVFPLAIKQSPTAANPLEERGFQIYQDLHTDLNNLRDRGVVSIGPYTPVFCLELACWLNEASWQSYYTPVGLSNKAPGPDTMNLEALGLQLEGAVLDEVTDTQTYVATNISPQIDGEEDSIIVVSFRGTANAANLKTDFRSSQVPLLDQITGIGSAPFCIYPDRLEVYDGDGWIWDTPQLRTGEDVKCFMVENPSGCMPFHHRREEPSALVAVSQGATALLKATPVVGGSFPCVHEGFQEVYTQVRKKVLDILLPVYQRQLAKSLNRSAPGKENEPLALPKIYLTGHSLGGSLAQLLALDLANNCEIVLTTNQRSQEDRRLQPEVEVFNLPTSPASFQMANSFDFTTQPSEEPEEIRLQPPVAVYTYGQPRVGNKAFARFYKQRVPHTFRVVNEGDAITSMPNFVFCSGIYKHAGLEVLLDEGRTGNILVGPTVVETMFRFHDVRTNIVAHTMERYRNCLECAFEQHELHEYYKGHNGGKDTDEIHPSNTSIPEWMTQVRTSKR